MAISFDNAGFSLSASASYAVGGGNNRILIVSVFSSAATTSPTVTYNGVSMTKIGVEFGASNTFWLNTFYLIAPATGSNTLAVSGSNFVSRHALSYAGVDQTSPITANTGLTNSAGDTTFTISNTVQNNCWMYLAVCANSPAVTAGTGSTQRLDDGNNQFSYDTNGSVGASGSHSMGANHGGTGLMSGKIVSFFPAVSTVNSNFLAFI